MEKCKDQIYKIRRGSHGENVIHAPIEMNGWFKLVVEKDGFRFVKVGN